ncbi:hypothetical protein AYL99_11889 [Fonsecaea erecta]|uniref:Uncharacterized protein n=1 Tax=Fonsecaea erecta TaxID=1367422 RepID=A0A178Z2D0_9EURO|nr:hypothetical protein AYL99_11889 [Fonsecaea erecta]OAP53867.1 hypothetical protein AYL99_11889 [Fonsecaea erecta]
MDSKPHICPICGEDKNPATARKVVSTAAITSASDNMTMESLPHPSVNIVTIYAVSQRPIRKVEVRIDIPLAKIIFEKMESGLFPDAHHARDQGGGVHLVDGLEDERQRKGEEALE